MNVCFAGDLFLGGDLFNKRGVDCINVTALQEAQKFVVNLEQPISDNHVFADKCTLYTGSFALKQLKDLKIDAVNLAHNHIQDKGLEGITETIVHLDSVKIGHFGAGRNIDQARKPYWLNETVALFGYCEHDKSYLKEIEIAGSNKAGVNLLRYDAIIEDLNELRENQKAILYFHWGREHVWLPRYEDIELSRWLLADDRVLLIVGMHSHRMQGYIEHNGKRAYMCLGNFLFPNFYIKPPAQICYPEGQTSSCDVTRQYHNVYRLTYKKWRLVNRISILLFFDITKQSSYHRFTYQSDNYPQIMELNGIKEFVSNQLVLLLSQVYKLPAYIYIPMETICSAITDFLWRVQIVYFKIKQLGVVESIERLISRIRRNWI